MKVQTFASPGTDLARRLERNTRGRDLVVGDIHGHFAALHRALAALEVGEHDRLFSLGDLVDHGPDSWAAKNWVAGPHASERFHLTIRGNHEQMMLAGLATGPRRGRRRLRDVDDWSIWRMNGGDWWETRKPGHSARSWMAVLCGLPWCARIETRFGWVGLVHASPVHARWQDLEEGVHGEEDLSHLTRARALWSRVRHGYVQRELRETVDEHVGAVEGVRAVVTGHTPVPEPVWHENVLGIDTGVHIARRGYGRLTIARIDAKEIETWSFERVAEDDGEEPA